MVIKTFSDGTQMLNTDRYEQYPIVYGEGAIAVDTDNKVSTSKTESGLVRNNSNWDEFREQANIELLMRYTKWLDRRGFFREDLQCDFEHQIKTFLNDFNVDN